jgi:hypothetical protein
MYVFGATKQTTNELSSEEQATLAQLVRAIVDFGARDPGQHETIP